MQCLSERFSDILDLRVARTNETTPPSITNVLSAASQDREEEEEDCLIDSLKVCPPLLPSSKLLPFQSFIFFF